MRNHTVLFFGRSNARHTENHDRNLPWSALPFPAVDSFGDSLCYRGRPMQPAARSVKEGECIAKTRFDPSANRQQCGH